MRRIVRGRTATRPSGRAAGAGDPIYSTARDQEPDPTMTDRSRPEPDARSSAATSSATGATAKGIGCTTPTARPYLDFANGIAVTALGHAHPRVTAAIHAQVDRLIGPINAIGFTAPISRSGGGAGGDVPGPARLGHVPQLRLGGDRRRAQARAPGDRPAGDHRVPRRLPRADVRGHQRHDARTSTTGPATSRSCRASTSRRIRSPIPSSAATRRRRRRRASASFARCSRRSSRRRRSARS